MDDTTTARARHEVHMSYRIPCSLAAQDAGKISFLGDYSIFARAPYLAFNQDKKAQKAP
jgi:hypothetical protein